MSAPTITRPRSGPVQYREPSYDNRQRRAPMRRRNMRRFVKRTLLAIFIGGVFVMAGGLLLLAWAWNSMALPSETPLIQTSYLTDANGNRLATLPGAENRTNVQIGDVPLVVRQAVMDTEDHDFYNHKGLDPRGIARALKNDVGGGSGLQGGSTLTQQYVKNEYAGTDRTLTRKFREAILSVKLEQKLTKDQIFERYLNAIYFGRGAYGVQAASKAYFNKDVKDLQLPEAAYLAGLIRGPELADVYSNPQTAAQRRDLTLGSMARYGDITPEQQQQVSTTDLKSYVVPRAAQEPTTVMADKGTQYFVDYVRNILINRYGEKLVTSGGLTVQTTLDPTLQAQAYDSVYNFLKPNEPAGALVSVDNNGYIKAMVGGRDYSASQVNLAVGSAGGGSGRQAGSTFKPIELAAALEAGVDIDETFPGPAKMNVKGWGTDNQVTNFGGENFGDIDLTEATVHSVNTVYAQLVVQQGVEGLISTANKMGIKETLAPNNSLVLGAAEVSPLEMANVYMTLANRGAAVDSTPILSVKSSDGETLETFTPKKTQVISQKTADEVTGVLEQVVQRGTGKAAGVNGKPIAGKTGTTENNGDAWFVGYTPNLSTAVWMGYPDGSSHTMNNVRGIAVTGGTFPAQIFNRFMTKATAKVDVPAFATTTTTSTSTSSTTTSTTEEPTTTTTQGGRSLRDRLQNLGAGEPGDGQDQNVDSAGNATTSTTEGPTTSTTKPKGNGSGNGKPTTSTTSDISALGNEPINGQPVSQ